MAPNWVPRPKHGTKALSVPGEAHIASSRKLPPPNFEKQRRMVSLALWAALIGFLTLCLSFSVTMVNVYKERKLTRLLTKLERLDKVRASASLNSQHVAFWSTISELTNGTEQAPKWVIRLGDFDSAAWLEEEIDIFKKAYVKARREYWPLKNTRRKSREFLRSAVLVAQRVREDQTTTILEETKADAKELSERRAYDTRYKRFRRSIRRIKRTLYENTKIALIVGSSIVFVFVLLFLILRLRALDGIAMATRGFQARDALTHEIGLPCFIVDANCTILEINEAATTALGLSRDSVVGKTMSEVLEYDDGQASRMEPRNVRAVHYKSGKISHFVAHPIRLLEFDGSERYSIICHDTSTIYELEVQKKVLSQFCHEARNKYTAAAGVLDLILLSIFKPADQLKSDLSALHDDIVMSRALLQEADMLIQTRLDLHRLYSGRYDTRQNTNVVDCPELLYGRSRAAAALAGVGIDFRIDIPKNDMELTIEVDTYIWTHIASNFLSNARKYTKSGHVTLRFIGEANSMLHFAVVDTGFGIPHDLAARLFREEVSTGAERGVGLGLVSCKKFANAIGGDCWLHATKVCTADDPSGGSEFRFCLPGRLVTTKRQSDEDASQPHNLSVLSNIRHVFIVEDSALIRKTIIAKLKHAAKAAQCDWALIEHATVESFSPSISDLANRTDILVTIDENLDAAGGRLKGSDLIRTLQTRQFYGVIISASGDANYAQKHKALGADLAWGKPFPNNARLIRDLCNVILAKQKRSKSEGCSVP